MTRSICAPLTLAIIVLLASSSAAAQSNRAGAGLERLKSLVGTWQGNNPEGKPVIVSYDVISGGTAVIETIKEGAGPGMVTIYHIDGDHLMLTHFCTMGNQPRMRAALPPGELGSLEFKFVDITNVTNHEEGHIRDLTITFMDDDNITQVWTWRMGGKDVAGTFNLARRAK